MLLNFLFFSREKPEQLLIKPSDLIDDVSSVEEKFNAEKSKEFQERVERYAKNLCGRIDTCSPGKPRLLLNKPIKLDKYSTEKVTPMSLKESVTLQLLQENKMKVQYYAFNYYCIKYDFC